MIWIDNSRIVAIVAVIFLHAAAGVVSDSPIGAESWWYGNLYNSLVRWCVPVFVMISGALLLDPGKKEDLKTFYFKRMSRIIMPILFWSAFFLIWTALKGAIKGEGIDPSALAGKILAGRPYSHLWFLYMIVFLYLFTPFFRKVILYSSRSELLVFILLTFLFCGINSFAARAGSAESSLFINWFLNYIPYFFLGYFIRTSETSYATPVLWSGFVVSALLTALGCYMVSINRGLDDGLYFCKYLSITVIPMSIFVFGLLKLCATPIGSERMTRKVASLTLGIYLVHPIFLEVLEYGGYGPLLFNPLISIPLISIVVFSFSLGIAWAISTIPLLRRVI